MKSFSMVLYPSLTMAAAFTAVGTTTAFTNTGTVSCRSSSFCRQPIALRQPITTTRSTALSMHFGHSHSHHGHDNRSSEKNQVLKDPTAVARTRRRRAALVLFTALCTLGPSVVMRKCLTRTDGVAFLSIAIILASADNIRSKFQSLFSKLQQWRLGLMKHSPSPSENIKNPVDFVFKNDNAADQVTLVGVLLNILLSSGKFAVGVTCHSSALIADAGHSLSDLFSDFVTLYSVQIARLPPDDDHPYGHGKFEAIGSLFLALTLLGTGISVGAMANKELLSIIQLQRSSGAAAAAATKLVQVPKPPALIMAFLSIVSKEWLYRITRKVGERINSQVVIANAWHHRSDAYSSVLALISIGLAMAIPSLAWADSAAGILVAGMICMTGADILGESIKQLSDSSNEELVHQVNQVLQQSVDDPEDDVVEIQRLRARQVGSSAMVDITLGTADELSGSAARTVEERIRSKLLRQVPGILDADVRTQPLGGNGVICPLLLSAQNTTLASIPSTSEVEHEVRERTTMQKGVTSLENIVVNYRETINVVVDVTIRVNPDQTLAQAKTYADDLKAALEAPSTLVDTAHIFLDMNYGHNKKQHGGGMDARSGGVDPLDIIDQTFTAEALTNLSDTNYTQPDPSLSSLAP